MNHLFLFTFILLFLSCSENPKPIERNHPEVQVTEKIKEPKIVFNDDFENGLQDFWVAETVDTTRYSIVSDPLNAHNKVLRVRLGLDDYSNGGKRSELKILHHGELDYKSEYSFRFMLPEDFFRTDEKSGFIIIHQWHDQADPGFNWSTQNKVTHPPIHLYIDRKEGGIYKLISKVGLKTGAMDETITSVWKGDLRPNEWYSYSCEIYWHIYTHTAYAKPKINGEYFYTSNDANGNYTHKIYRRNMYNGIGNYPKLGLYRFGNELEEKTIYFDDFKLVTKKSECSDMR